MTSTPTEIAAARIDILSPRSTDDEASAILDDLSKLQTLLTLQMRHGAVWIGAADLVQRTRILIIERCGKKQADAQTTPESNS